MIRILYLTFYFEPDLCAGSFRNTTLAKTLSDQLGNNGVIDVVTTFPNRYKTYKVEASYFEDKGNLRVHRIKVPKHKSGFLDQIFSFKAFYKGARKIVKGNDYDLIFASSSRLFTAYLGYKIAHKLRKPLYLDIRDIFVDTMEEVLKNQVIKWSIISAVRRIEKKTFNYAIHINLISGGFSFYFTQFKCKSFSNFSNGIDDEFLNIPMTENLNQDIVNKQKTIVYAGNIGEGQGLDKIIPPAARELGDGYKFIIVGDGGAKQKLSDAILAGGLHEHIELRNPVGRKELIDIYSQADFLFIHLNDYKAFEKVLPSKVFELGAYNKPVIAGVSGFSHQFLKDNIPNVILFKSCDAKDFVQKMKNYNYRIEVRSVFIEHYKREHIDKKMAESILNFIQL